MTPQLHGYENYETSLMIYMLVLNVHNIPTQVLGPLLDWTLASGCAVLAFCAVLHCAI